jgi:hypothetical protein
VYRELGGYRDREFKNTSDLEMWLRIARSYEIGVLEAHLLRYRRGHGSSSERYHRARTDPERFFVIMDRELQRDDARAVAACDAVAAYEAHRSEDVIMRSVSHYVLGDRSAAAATARELRLRRLMGSSAVQRWRLAALVVGLRALVRLPRISMLANAFDRRWHGGADATARTAAV